MRNITLTMFIGGIFVGLGICLVSLFLMMIGIVLIFIPIFVGSVQNSFTPQGRKNSRKYFEREKQIEKNFGIVDYKNK